MALSPTRSCRAKGYEGVGQALAVEYDTFAHFQRRGGVIQSDEQDLHRHLGPPKRGRLGSNAPRVRPSGRRAAVGWAGVLEIASYLVATGNNACM